MMRNQYYAKRIILSVIGHPDKPKLISGPDPITPQEYVAHLVAEPVSYVVHSLDQLRAHLEERLPPPSPAHQRLLLVLQCFYIAYYYAFANNQDRAMSGGVFLRELVAAGALPHVTTATRQTLSGVQPMNGEQLDHKVAPWGIAPNQQSVNNTTITQILKLSESEAANLTAALIQAVTRLSHDSRIPGRTICQNIFQELLAEYDPSPHPHALQYNSNTRPQVLSAPIVQRIE